jgi:hypothetical protein
MLQQFFLVLFGLFSTISCSTNFSFPLSGMNQSSNQLVASNFKMFSGIASVKVYKIEFSTDFHLHNIPTDKLNNTDLTVISDLVCEILDLPEGNITFIKQTPLNEIYRNQEFNVKYEIKTSTNDFPNSVFYNSTQLYDRLTNTLIKAVSNQNFTNELRVKADLYNASDLHMAMAIFVNISKCNVESGSASPFDPAQFAIDFFAVVAILLISCLIMTAGIMIGRQFNEKDVEPSHDIELAFTSPGPAGGSSSKFAETRPRASTFTMVADMTQYRNPSSPIHALNLHPLSPEMEGRAGKARTWSYEDSSGQEDVRLNEMM